MNNKKIFGISILLLISLISLNSVFAIDGWTNTSGNWTNNSIGDVIRITNNGVLLSTPFDIEADKDYVLNATVTGNCIVFNITENCIKPDGSLGNCGIGKSIIPGNTVTIASINNNNFYSAFDTKYFRNVQLQITSTCNSLQTIANISLKEVTSPSSACCPADYCWNGNYCVNSNDWMNNSSMPPAFHDILSENWTNSHVNVSAVNIATGYRCVVNGSGFADWKLSELKYDWNFEKSGYCARETDCFVSYDLPKWRNDDGNINNYIYSQGCIPTGGVINDNYQTGSGNHYCHQGNWTTKSYVIATFLQGITVGPYVVHCYDDVTKAHNNFGLSINENDFIASCTISQPESDEVITGVVLSDSDYRDNFPQAIAGAYETYYSKSISVDPECTTTALEGELNFTTCVDDNDLNIYYNKRYDYFIVSTKKITEIDTPNLIESAWNGLKNFFKSIFVKEATLLDPYNSIGYTTSYDRIYILKNDTLTVTALEEKKYDEIEQKQVTVLYAEYIGTNNSDNLIDHKTIISAANKSVNAEGNTLLKTTYSYNDTLKIQKIIIKTDNRTGLWTYFAPSLRLQ